MKESIRIFSERFSTNENSAKEIQKELSYLLNMRKNSGVSRGQVWSAAMVSSVAHVGVRRLCDNEVHFSHIKDDGDLANTVIIHNIDDFTKNFTIEPNMYLINQD